MEWLGDVGGLFDGLRGVGHLFIGPIATIAMQRLLLKEYKPAKFVDNQGYIFCCRPRDKRLKLLLSKTEMQVMQKLDLVGLIRL